MKLESREERMEETGGALTRKPRFSEKPSTDRASWKDGFTISTAIFVAVGSKLALITILVIFIFGDRETSLLLPVSPRNSSCCCKERVFTVKRQGNCLTSDPDAYVTAANKQQSHLAWKATGTLGSKKLCE